MKEEEGLSGCYWNPRRAACLVNVGGRFVDRFRSFSCRGTQLLPQPRHKQELDTQKPPCCPYLAEPATVLIFSSRSAARPPRSPVQFTVTTAPPPNCSRIWHRLVLELLLGPLALPLTAVIAISAACHRGGRHSRRDAPHRGQHASLHLCPSQSMF